MDDRLKQRLVGAGVLVLAAVVFVPMLLEMGGQASSPSGHTLVSPPVPETAPQARPEDATARAIPLDREAAPQEQAARPPAQPAAEKPSAPPAASSISGTSGSKSPERKSGFAVQLGSFSKAANARGLRDRLVAKGYAAYLVTTDSITRVYVGPQPSRAEAERVREKLLAETKLKGIVVEHAG